MLVAQHHYVRESALIDEYCTHQLAFLVHGSSGDGSQGKKKPSRLTQNCMCTIQMAAESAGCTYQQIELVVLALYTPSIHEYVRTSEFENISKKRRVAFLER